jgi:hypothetical protein
VFNAPCVLKNCWVILSYPAIRDKIERLSISLIYLILRLKIRSGARPPCLPPWRHSSGAPSSMPKKKKWREPELPWSLQDELNPDRVRDAKAPKKKAVGANRKQMRKEARQQKKVRPRPPGRPKSQPEPEPEPEPEPPRKEKRRAAAPAPAPAPAKKKKPHTPTAFEEMLRERGVLKSTEGRGAGGQSMDALDDHIDDLERKLGLKKGKTAKAAKQRLERELAEDGLGSSAAGSKARLVSRS